MVKTIWNTFDESNYTPVKLVLDEERQLSFTEMEIEENKAPQKTKIELLTDPA